MEKVSAYQKKLERRLSLIIVNEFVKLKREDRPLYKRILKGIVLWESE